MKRSIAAVLAPRLSPTSPTRPRTGHGIGIGVHEAPSVIEGEDTELAAGMVVAVEAGVYFPAATASAPRTPSRSPTRDRGA